MTPCQFYLGSSMACTWSSLQRGCSERPDWNDMWIPCFHEKCTVRVLWPWEIWWRDEKDWKGWRRYTKPGQNADSHEYSRIDFPMPIQLLIVVLDISFCNYLSVKACEVYLPCGRPMAIWDNGYRTSFVPWQRQEPILPRQSCGHFGIAWHVDNVDLTPVVFFPSLIWGAKITAQEPWDSWDRHSDVSHGSVVGARVKPPKTLTPPRPPSSDSSGQRCKQCKQCNNAPQCGVRWVEDFEHFEEFDRLQECWWWPMVSTWPAHVWSHEDKKLSDGQLFEFAASRFRKERNTRNTRNPAKHDLFVLKIKSNILTPSVLSQVCSLAFFR